ncbi:hypothetical protein [Limnoglobus roseus]|uniref:Uncharacterized protein n=1 Tax=Limnoglobus roseus TaxID=2598579 RepID=A0A5C1ARL2_9BACT|nr:hypothetical protein [Limnoglobus roseus]QEL19498.1 hypothetical protein PX52LOC_06572 [Limnoglobus roseus]
MPQKPFDPLARIPSPGVIRQKLTETRTLAERLQILLETSERIAAADGSGYTAESVRSTSSQQGGVTGAD